MRFSVTSSVENSNTLIWLSDNNHSTSVTIIPEAGALLHEFNIPVDGQPFNIIENYATDRPVKEQVPHYFRSAKLSPWPCRLADGRYEHNGKTYQIERMFTDGTALHGLLFDQEFRVVDLTANNEFASVELAHDYKGYDAGYPFPYKCTVKYVLHPRNVLKVTTTLTNTGDQTIPIADGWHPYFKLGGKVDDWDLFIDAAAKVEFDDRLIPTGKMLDFDQFRRPTRIGNIEMDNCFLINLAPHNIVCTLRNPSNNVLVAFMPGVFYSYLQLFIPDHRQSIAVENLNAIPNSFNNDFGGAILPPGVSHTNRLSYIAMQLPADRES